MTHGGFPRWIRRDTGADAQGRSAEALWQALKLSDPPQPQTSQVASGALPDDAARTVRAQ